jgi:hypothetical protein
MSEVESELVVKEGEREVRWMNRFIAARRAVKKLAWR